MKVENSLLRKGNRLRFALLAWSLAWLAGLAGNAAAESAAVTEIVFPSAGVELAGSLYLPDGEDFSSALVLLAGSDRSARGPARLKLAQSLAERGTAVLVYDSPGTGASRAGNARFQTRDERVAEALDAAAFLRGHPDLRGARVGLMGGSEGADIALLAAARDSSLAFVIAYSAAVDAPILELLSYSAEKRGQAAGLNDAEILKAATFKELSYAILAGVEICEWSLLEERVRRWNSPAWTDFVALSRRRCAPMSPLGEVEWLEAFRESLAAFTAEPWFHSIVGAREFQSLAALDAPRFFGFLDKLPYDRDWRRDVSAELSRIRVPLLALWGEEDDFLPPRRGAARLQRILSDAGHADFTLRIIPGADHSLLSVDSSGDYVAEFMPTLTSWLNRR